MNCQSAIPMFEKIQKGFEEDNLTHCHWHDGLFASTKACQQKTLEFH